MVVSVELRGKYQRRIWNGPADQLEAMQAIASEALVAFCFMGTHLHLVLELESIEASQSVIGTIARRLDATAEERGVARLDVPHVDVLTDDHAVLRYIAYAHANPVKQEWWATRSPGRSARIATSTDCAMPVGFRRKESGRDSRIVTIRLGCTARRAEPRRRPSSTDRSRANGPRNHSH
jgi:hypothetical protein